jgi:hypothetical protein
MMVATRFLGTVMDIVAWLRSLGLGKYEAAFGENEVDETVLPSLTHENLKELGVASFGHRLKPLDATLLCLTTRAASHSKPANCSLRSTAGLPKGSTRAI